MKANTDYNYSFSLRQFDRASAIAQNFKFYRPKRVVWTYIPDFNTFQQGAGVVSMPQVSMIMNRSGDNTIWTLVEYDAQGAVPGVFTKKKVVAYKPNIVQSIQYIAQNEEDPASRLRANLGSRPLYDEWITTGIYNSDLGTTGYGLPTQIFNVNDSLLFQGHSMFWGVTSTAPLEPDLGTCFCEVEWEFKDPLYAPRFSETPPTAEQGTTAGGV